MPDESNSNIRRLIEQGAVSIDGQKMTDVNEEVTPKSGSILKTGKIRRSLKKSGEMVGLDQEYFLLMFCVFVVFLIKI